MKHTNPQVEQMTSFIVMDVLERANELQKQGVDIIHLEVGEPDFDVPSCVSEAAKAAYALEFIEKLPQGFDTVIGENGASLSGGQRQRLAIARALLRNSPVLILDEATSALDTESERAIQSALEELKKDRTVLVIAHRLSTIENADEILVIEHGEIKERGTHQDLLALDGAYKQLHSMQFSG